MDILFQNDYERNPEVTKEIYRHICFLRPVHIAIYAVVGAGVLWNIAAAIWFWDFAFAPAAYGFLLLLIQFIRYKKIVSIVTDRDREQHGTQSLKVHMVVTDQGIRCIYGENKANPFALSSIKKVYKTKNFIVLLTKAQLLLVFERKSFTVGTADAFLEYLRANGLKV